MKFIKKINKNVIIKNSFLLPILSVVVMSISHVISWYDIGNPMSWAIYLSVAIEVFALASVSASSLKMKKGSIWLLFILVTLIQIIGNIFFTYKEINISSPGFISWMELIEPFVSEDWNSIDHRRFLSYIQGGTLPFMSLIALHFYIVFNDNIKNGLLETETEINEDKTVEEVSETKPNEIVPVMPMDPPTGIISHMDLVDSGDNQPSDVSSEEQIIEESMDKEIDFVEVKEEVLHKSS